MCNQKFILITTLLSIWACNAMDGAGEHAVVRANERERDPRMSVQFVLNSAPLALPAPTPLTFPIPVQWTVPVNDFVTVSQFNRYTMYELRSPIAGNDVIKRCFECTLCGSCFERKQDYLRHFWASHISFQ